MQVRHKPGMCTKTTLAYLAFISKAVKTNTEKKLSNVSRLEALYFELRKKSLLLLGPEGAGLRFRLRFFLVVLRADAHALWRARNRDER